MLQLLSIPCNWNVAKMCGRLTNTEEIWIPFSIFTSCKITNSELQGPTFFVTDHKQFNSDFLWTSKCLFGLNLVSYNVFSWFYALRFGVLRALKRFLSFMRGIPRRNWTKEKLFLETKNSFNVWFDPAFLNQNKCTEIETWVGMVRSFLLYVPIIPRFLI